MKTKYLPILAFLSVILTVTAIRDESNQDRWEQPGKGLDAEVPGFLINLGPTGGRAILRQNTFLVKYIFKNSPAYGQLEINDVITGANGRPFGNHVFGGNKNLGIEGPIYDLGMAIEDAEGSDGKLTLQVQRGGSKMNVVIQLEKLGRFSATFPENCAKTKLLHKRALDYLASGPGMGPDGRCAAILALISSEHKTHQAAGKAMVQKYRVPGAGTWSWQLAFQTIAMAEYHLLTQDRSVLPVLQDTMNLMRVAQYKAPGIKKWRAKEGEDQALIDKHTQLYDGGFGHAPFKNGYDSGGYGPMQSPTILSVLGWQLGKECGLKVDPAGIKSALKFMDYGTNNGGNVAYGGEFTLAFGIRDPAKFKSSTKRGNSAKSGLSILAYNMTPEYEKSQSYIKLHKENIHETFKGMNNGHADGIMAMTWGILGTGASGDEELKRKVFNYFKVFLNVTRCHGSKNYVALPGRDYADGAYYRDGNRTHVTAMAALLYSFYNPKLQVHGVQVAIPGVNHRELKVPLSTAYQQIIEGKYGQAARAITDQGGFSSGSPGEKMLSYLNAKAKILTSAIEENLISGRWIKVQKTFAEMKPYWTGVPHYDNRVNYFKSLLTDAGGQQLLKADLACTKNKFGIALKLADEAHKAAAVDEVKEIAAKVTARLDKQADAFALKLKHMEVKGEWYTLFLELKKIPETYGGIEPVDKLSVKLIEPFKSPSGKALASTHKYFLDGNYAASYKTVQLIKQKAKVVRHKKIAAVLEKKILEKASEKVSELEEIKSGGAWYSLYLDLSKNRKSYAGIKEFDLFYNTNLALIKSSSGKALVSSEKLLRGRKYSLAAKGLKLVLESKMPQDVKDIAKSVLSNINSLVEPEISSLVKLEEEGDWYALQQNLGKLIRDFNGIDAFDEKRKHWDENIRKNEINKIINAGKEFASLKKSWLKGKTDSRKRKLKTFADENKDNLYGRKATQLLGN